jgi:hypothetical protein
VLSCTVCVQINAICASIGSGEGWKETSLSLSYEEILLEITLLFVILCSLFATSGSINLCLRKVCSF